MHTTPRLLKELYFEEDRFVKPCESVTRKGPNNNVIMILKRDNSHVVRVNEMVAYSVLVFGFIARLRQ